VRRWIEEFLGRSDGAGIEGVSRLGPFGGRSRKQEVWTLEIVARRLGDRMGDVRLDHEG